MALPTPELRVMPSCELESVLARPELVPAHRGTFFLIRNLFEPHPSVSVDDGVDGNVFWAMFHYVSWQARPTFEVFRENRFAKALNEHGFYNSYVIDSAGAKNVVGKVESTPFVEPLKYFLEDMFATEVPAGITTRSLQQAADAFVMALRRVEGDRVGILWPT